ncbi:hypothetical protein B0J14DRAFT_556738 [Halenospora varia]|nr:hypothetical protein B0J14DRAFT_556738 [Halenospora varia]
MDSNAQASSDRDERTLRTFWSPTQASASDAPSPMMPLTNQTQFRSSPARIRISNQPFTPGRQVPFAFAGPPMVLGQDPQGVGDQRPQPEHTTYLATPLMRPGPVGDFRNSQPPQSAETFCFKDVPGIDCACDACYITPVPTEELPFGQSPHTAHGSFMHGNQSAGIDTSHHTWQSVATPNTRLHMNQSPYASYRSNINHDQYPSESSSYLSTPVPNRNLNFTNSSALSNPFGQFSTSHVARGSTLQAQPILTASTAIHDENTTQDHSDENSRPRVKRRRQLRNKHTPAEIPHKVNESAPLDNETFLKVQKYFNIEFGDSTLPSNAEREDFARFLKLSLPQIDTCIKTRAVIMPILIGLSNAITEEGVSIERATQWFDIVHSQQSSKKHFQDSAYLSNLNTARPGPNPKKRKRSTTAGPYQCTYIGPSGDYCLKLTNRMVTRFIEKTSYQNTCGNCIVVMRISKSDWNRRCEHVGPHFEGGKRMVADWRDPWPASEGNISQPPSDDDDDDNDGDNDDEEDDDNIGRDDNNYNDDSYDNDGKHEDDEDLYSASPVNRHNGNTPTGNVQNHSGISSVSSYVASNTESTRHAPSFTPNSSLPDRETTSSTFQTPERGQEPFQFIKRLGHGSFGVVDEVEHCVTKKVFARKSVREITPRSVLTMSQARRELLALRTLKHSHIIKVVASYSVGNTFAMIMSPVAEYNLHQFMREEGSTPLTKASKLSRWVGCLTSAVSYIHKQSWQHFDIKPMNILVSGGDIIISDFGGAFLTTGNSSGHRSCAVTPMYCAPELTSPIACELVPGASDIYSLGCVFLEMATVIHREDLNTFESFRKFDSRDGTYHNNIWKSSIWLDFLREIEGRVGIDHEGFLDVLSEMLSDDVSRRPSAERVWEIFQLYPSTTQPPCKSRLLQFNNLKEDFDPMKVTQNWLRDCLENHIHCPKPTPTYFPSRILNVGLDSQMVHLESHVFQGSKPYVTLSHCWGSGDILKTTSENFSQMTNGIQISSLSDSFFNAVSITRALGFTYLWIDALCILQDSVEDWSFQSSQMHKVYSNSSLTICMTSSGKPKPKQPQISFNTHTTSESVPSCSACTNDYPILRPLTTTSMATMFLDSPWWTRAWVMQEVLLSGRVLYFSSSEMAWECGSTTSAKDIISRLRRNLKLLAKQIPPAEAQSLTASPGLLKLASSFRKSWRTIVEEYSKRELTHHQDKLPALAGVAAKFAEVSGQIYVAGLWAEDLMQGLLWCRSFASVPLARPAYCAPSWSWASIDGPIIWHKSVVDLPDLLDSAVLDYSTTPRSPRFTYGGVSNGYLEIRGMLRRGVTSPTKSQDVLDSSTKEQFAFASWDTLDSLERYRPKSSSKHEIVEGVWCLQIREGAGLILHEISRGQHERVGMFWISEKGASKPFAKSSWELKTVTIV